jgi:hypothetical protein
MRAAMGCGDDGVDVLGSVPAFEGFQSCVPSDIAGDGHFRGPIRDAAPVVWPLRGNHWSGRGPPGLADGSVRTRTGALAETSRGSYYQPDVHTISRLP